MKLFPLLCAVLIAASRVCAQQPAPTPPVLPSGPLLNRAPAFSQWLVTDMVPGGAKPGSDADSAGIKGTVILRTLITKTGPIVHQETADYRNLKQDFWIKGKVETAMFAGWKSPSIQPLSQDYSKIDFPGFEWIAASNFTGIQKLLGTDCLVFINGAGAAPSPGAAVPSATPRNGLPPDADPNRTTAWIALDSRLPLLLTGQGQIHVYQFRTAPQAIQTLPPAVQAIMSTYASQLNDLYGRRSDPP